MPIEIIDTEPKKIIGRPLDKLTEVSSAGTADLLLIRPEGSASDKIIKVGNLAETVNYPTPAGFAAYAEGDNKIRLDSLATKKVSYIDGLVISFISPIDTEGNAVDIRVDSNEYCDLGDYTTDDDFFDGNVLLTIPTLVKNGFYTAVYVANQDCFLLTSSTERSTSEIQEKLNKASVVGYRSVLPVLPEQQVITLKAVNNSSIGSYYDQMFVSFVTPVGMPALSNPKIRIDGLAATEIYEERTSTPALLGQRDYVQCYYSGGKFYRISAGKFYTNDYKVTAINDAVEGVTTIKLASATGSRKSALYDQMSVLFTSTKDIKGLIALEVDGLSAKYLQEDADDAVDNPVYENETILAIYNLTDNCFVRRGFNTSRLQMPLLKPIEIAIDQVENEIEVKPPIIRQETFLVGTGGKYSTINEALEAAIKEFGNEGSDSSVNIRLKTGFVIKEQIIINESTNLSYITLTSEDANVNVDIANFISNINLNSLDGYPTNLSFLVILQRSISFNININFTLVNSTILTGNKILNFIYLGQDSNLKISNSTFTGFDTPNITLNANFTNGWLQSSIIKALPGSKLYTESCTFTGNSAKMFGLILLTSTYYDTNSSFIGDRLWILQGFNFKEEAQGSRGEYGGKNILNLLDTNFSAYNSSSPDSRPFGLLTSNNTMNFENVTVTGFYTWFKDTSTTSSNNITLDSCTSVCGVGVSQFNNPQTWRIVNSDITYTGTVAYLEKGGTYFSAGSTFNIENTKFTTANTINVPDAIGCDRRAQGVIKNCTIKAYGYGLLTLDGEDSIARVLLDGGTFTKLNGTIQENQKTIKISTNVKIKNNPIYTTEIVPPYGKITNG